MHSLVRAKNAELTRICERHNVQHLELFGSAATNSSNEKRSDVDCLVEFKELTPAENAETFWGLLEDLEQLFGLEVDLVEPRAIRNPYFLEAIEPQRITLYAAA